MTFGKRLMQLRKEQGYRNRDSFAAELGIPSPTLRNYEMDIREPGFGFLIQMSQRFHVSTDYLLCLTDEKTVSASDSRSLAEQKLVENYRHLDPVGKELVDHTLLIEVNRTNLLQGQEKRLAQYAELLSTHKLF